ncbi:MAG: bifunctional DNA primase/polymerase [Planctomycetaceae bacterium]
MSAQQTALDYRRAGLCVLPAILAEKRPDLPAWEPYERRLPTERQVGAWFADETPLCIVAGKISGHLEVLDFDHQAELYEPWRALVEAEAPGLIDRLLIERSQSDGRHVVYRCATSIDGNRKLAQRVVLVESADPVTINGKPYKPRRVGDEYVVMLTLIETRGERGLFLCAPTPGYLVLQGSFVDLPVVTEAERELLIEAACALTEWVPPAAEVPIGSPASGRPGDEFNERGSLTARLLIRRNKSDPSFSEHGNSHSKLIILTEARKVCVCRRIVGHRLKNRPDICSPRLSFNQKYFLL